jgi:hypothetical protein
MHGGAPTTGAVMVATSRKLYVFSVCDTGFDAFDPRTGTWERIDGLEHPPAPRDGGWTGAVVDDRIYLAAARICPDTSSSGPGLLEIGIRETEEMQAIADLDPDLLLLEVRPDLEPVEPVEQVLFALVELPGGLSGIDVDPDSIVLSDADGLLASAYVSEVVADRLLVGFLLDLELVSRIAGVPAGEVDVDLWNHTIEVKVLTAPTGPLDLKHLRVSGELFGGDTFTAVDAIRLHVTDWGTAGYPPAPRPAPEVPVAP